MKNFIVKLKGLETDAINPRAEWLQANRAVLLSQIKNTLPVAGAHDNNLLNTSWENIWSRLAFFIPKTIVYNIARPFAIVMVAVVIVTSGSIKAVDAAYDALPGDGIYAIKRGIEKTQGAMADIIGDKNVTTKLHMEFAKRRANEVKNIIIIGKGSPSNISAISATMADLKTEIAVVDNKLDEAKVQDGSSNLQAGVVKGISQDSQQINVALQDLEKGLNSSSTLANKALSQEVNDTKNLVKDVSVKAVEVMVNKQLAGDTTVSTDEVKQVLTNTLQSATLDVSAARQNVAGVNSIVENAKTEVVNLAGDVRKQNDIALTTSTKQFSDQINAVANQTVAAVIKTEAASVAIDKTVTEAQALLSNGDLTKVVDKIKEVNQATQAAENISDKTLATAQTVLPIVQTIKDNIDAASSSSTLKDAVSSSSLSNLAGFVVVTTTATNVVTSTIKK